MQIVTVKPGNKPDLIAGHFFNEQTMVEDSMLYAKELEEALEDLKDIPITITARPATDDEVLLFFVFLMDIFVQNKELIGQEGSLHLPPSFVVNCIRESMDNS